MNLPGQYGTDEHECHNCANDGTLIPISKRVLRKGYGCEDYELWCQRCGFRWQVLDCGDGFSTHSNDEREC